MFYSHSSVQYVPSRLGPNVCLTSSRWQRLVAPTRNVLHHPIGGYTRSDGQLAKRRNCFLLLEGMKKRLSFCLFGITDILHELGVRI